MKYLPFLVLFILLFSCNSKNEQATGTRGKDTLTVPKKVQKVVGIGKIEPLNGLVNLASDAGGIVYSINRQAGDTVKKGTLILTLKQREADLEVQQLKDQIATQQQQLESDKIAVRQYKIQLQNKEQTLKTSKKLAETGAETRENVENLITDKKVLEVQLAQSQKVVSIDHSKIKTLQTQLQSAEHKLKEKTIRAPSDGVILNMNAQIGSAIEPLTSFATFAPAGPRVVHGEADEMFANKLRIGQQAKVHYIGDAHTITTGEIIYLSPELSNKSLFTDAPGEKQDRRVRRFKVLLDHPDNLLLNSKVECIIYLKNENP